jgi:hypothetical protein
MRERQKSPWIFSSGDRLREGYAMQADPKNLPLPPVAGSQFQGWQHRGIILVRVCQGAAYTFRTGMCFRPGIRYRRYGVPRGKKIPRYHRYETGFFGNIPESGNSVVRSLYTGCSSPAFYPMPIRTFCWNIRIAINRRRTPKIFLICCSLIRGAICAPTNAPNAAPAP